ncbi:MAG: ABC transporter ATP-binding protein [Armatimonadetes bacterium]|nr:ABC transporter ATP-binding protein [Armatimonadota bacterium]
MNQPLVTDNLTKVYNLGRRKAPKTALDSLSIEVPEGVIFGFLGPNGAGKTTTIKLILDFVRPTRGSATVFGNPTTRPRTRELIGYLPEQPYFHRFLKPMEVVAMHAGLAGMKSDEIPVRSISALEKVGIAEYADTPIAKLSKGLTQRVGIAQAIVGDPKLLILDEPTSGLDPIGRRHTRDLLLSLKNEGKTIFLSSHLLGEVENICDIVAVLKSGKLVACGSPDMVRGGDAQVVVRTSLMDENTRDRLRFADASIERQSDCTLVRVEPGKVYELMRVMEELSLPIFRIDTQRESLEEAFLRLAA